MCSAVLRSAIGLTHRRFLECSTNADALWFDAMAHANAEKCRLVSIEPCFFALESAVNLAEMEGEEPADPQLIR